MIRSPRAYLAAAALTLAIGASAAPLTALARAEPAIPGRRDAFGRQKYGTPSVSAKYRQGLGQDRKEKRYVRKGLRP
jgi:hypothetical protein